MLKLAPGLSLPDDVLTEALAVTGTRGSGKTYTSKKLVELMTDLGLPTCVIDPLGVWWGLRSSADGKKPGLPFVVLGGDKGDVPLEPTAGKVIAEGRTLSQLAILTGRSSKSSGFKNALSSLRTSGALLGSNKDVMKATESGLDRLGDWDPLPSGRALVDHWMRNLGKPERAVLEVLVGCYPTGLDMEHLANEAGYAMVSSGYKNALSKLRTLGLLEGGNQEIMHASEIFFTHGDWR